MSYLKDQCTRCFVGIDDDKDGNCAVCVRLSDHDAFTLRHHQMNNIQRVADLTRQGTFEELKTHLMNEPGDPVLSIRHYQARYPKFGDLEGERLAAERKQAVVKSSYPGVVLEFAKKEAK